MLVLNLSDSSNHHTNATILVEGCSILATVYVSCCSIGDEPDNRQRSRRKRPASRLHPLLLGGTVARPCETTSVWTKLVRKAVVVVPRRRMRAQALRSA